MGSTIINEIMLTSVKFAVHGEGHEISLEWELNGGRTKLCEKEYHLAITQNGEDFYQVNFHTEGGDTDYLVELSNEHVFESGQVYMLCLKVDGADDSVTLYTDTFENLEGEYDGERFVFRWKIGAKRVIPTGICGLTVQADNIQAARTIRTPVNPYYGKLTVNNFYDSGENPVQAVFVAGDGKVSYGPDGIPLIFYPQGARILTAELAPDEDKENLTLILQKNYDGIPAVRLLFMKNGRILLQKDAEKSEECTENEQECYRVSVDIRHDELMAQTLRECVVHCQLVNGKAVTAVHTSFSEISLAVPVVTPQAVGQTCQGSVYIGSEIMPSGFEFKEGKMSYESIGDCTPDFMARACYDLAGTSRRGPWSLSGFESCYYTENGIIFYRGQSYEEKEVRYTFPAAWFHNISDTDEHVFSASEAETTNAQESQRSVFELNRVDNQYELVIKTDAAVSTGDYDSFLNQVKNLVKPQAFYAINDTIVRTAPYAFADTMHFLCSYSPQERYADLRPGLSVRVESAMDQPPYSKKDREGIAWCNTSEFEVTFSAHTGFLEFNDYAAQMLKYENQSATADDGKTFYAAGVMDLLRPALRQPYYRLLYPSAFPAMDSLSQYPSDNTVLIAADQYGKLISASEQIRMGVGKSFDLPVPVVVFRGRALLSLYVKVSLNGSSYHVPVGSSIEQALAQCGVSRIDHVKLFRRGQDGRSLRVYGNLEGLPLISGDCMEV